MSGFLSGLGSFLQQANPAIAAGADVAQAIGANFAADPRVREQMMQRRQQMADIGQRQQAEHMRQQLDEWNALGKHFETLSSSPEALKAWDSDVVQGQLDLWLKMAPDVGANPALAKAWRTTMDARAHGQPTEDELLAQRQKMSAAEATGQQSAQLDENTRLARLRQEEEVRAKVAKENRVPTRDDLIAELLYKVKNGIQLTPNEADALNLAQSTSAANRLFGGAVPPDKDIVKRHTQGYTPPAQTGNAATAAAPASATRLFAPQPTGVGRGPAAPAVAGTPAQTPTTAPAAQPAPKAPAAGKPGSSREAPAKPPEQAKGQGVAAHEGAVQAWFNALPVGAWFVNPTDQQVMQKIR